VRLDCNRAHQKRKKLEDCGLNLREWLQSGLKTGKEGVFQTLPKFRWKLRALRFYCVAGIFLIFDAK